MNDLTLLLENVTIHKTIEQLVTESLMSLSFIEKLVSFFIKCKWSITTSRGRGSKDCTVLINCSDDKTKSDSKSDSVDGIGPASDDLIRGAINTPCSSEQNSTSSPVDATRAAMFRVRVVLFWCVGADTRYICWGMNVK